MFNDMVIMERIFERYVVIMKPPLILILILILLLFLLDTAILVFGRRRHRSPLMFLVCSVVQQAHLIFLPSRLPSTTDAPTPTSMIAIPRYMRLIAFALMSVTGSEIIALFSVSRSKERILQTIAGVPVWLIHYMYASLSIILGAANYH